MDSPCPQCCSCYFISLITTEDKQTITEQVVRIWLAAKLYIQVYPYEIKFHFSLRFRKLSCPQSLIGMKKPKGKESQKSKLPYGIAILRKIHVSILFQPEVD